MNITLEDIKDYRKVSEETNYFSVEVDKKTGRILVAEYLWSSLLDLAEKALKEEKDIESRLARIIDEYKMYKRNPDKLVISDAEWRQLYETPLRYPKNRSLNEVEIKEIRFMGIPVESGKNPLDYSEI